MRGSANLNKRDHRQLSCGPIRRPHDRYAVEDNQRQEYGSRQLQVTQRLVNEQPTRFQGAPAPSGVKPNLVPKDGNLLRNCGRIGRKLEQAARR